MSWVSFSSGWRLDLEKLVERAHERGILVMLDAIQGLGVFPLDVRRIPIDFASADGHKWLLGPEGASILFVQAQHLDLLRPLNVGWNSVVHRMDYAKIRLDIRPEAARYEGGSQNMVGVAGFLASLELLIEHGLSPDGEGLSRRVIEVSDYAVERLRSRGAEIFSDRTPGHQSGIVSFGFEKIDPVPLRHECMQADVIISCRNGRLRISPHAYNNEEDVDRLIDALPVVA